MLNKKGVMLNQELVFSLKSEIEPLPSLSPTTLYSPSINAEGYCFLISASLATISSRLSWSIWWVVSRLSIVRPPSADLIFSALIAELNCP